VFEFKAPGTAPWAFFIVAIILISITIITSMKPGILVISGPSGAGKSRLYKDLLQVRPFAFSISATSRAMRPGEVDGVDYHFITQAAFEQKIAEGAFIEYEEVHTKSYYYGTLKAPIAKALADGGPGMLFEVDVRGHANLKKLLKMLHRRHQLKIHIRFLDRLLYSLFLALNIVRFQV
jgi:guanylate kinase